METRYQVFVSSTFVDLQEERKQVTYALLSMNCIPAGMEIFPASSDDQWTLIKRVIDECDYCLLILGGRYGSLDNAGMGYTEKEFDYAVERGKPVISFLHGSPGSIPVDKSERDPELQKKLEAFRRKVQQRMVKYWTSPGELAAEVAASIFNLIRSHPAEGWVRGNRNGYADFFQGLSIDKTAIEAFQDGGSYKRLKGTWEAHWYGFDSTGNPEPYLVSDPNDPAVKIQYPPEIVVLETSCSIVFCTAQKSYRELRYWMGGRISQNNELCLIYWNENISMGGTVLLTLTEKLAFALELAGWWCGHNIEGKVFFGRTKWIKKD